MQQSPFQVPASFGQAFTAIRRSLSALFERPLLYVGLTLAQFVSLLVALGLGQAAPRGWFAIAYILIPMTCVLPLGAMLHAACEHLAGRDMTLSASLAVGLRRALPLLGVAVLLTLIIGLAMIALIVPGLILMTVYIVAMPVAVQERRGVLGALRRASSLSNGYRTTLFVIGVGYFLVAFAVLVGLSLPGAMVAFMTFPLLGPAAIQIVGLAIIAVLYVALGALFPVLLCATYLGLREAKEGGPPEQVAGVGT